MLQPPIYECIIQNPIKTNEDEVGEDIADEDDDDGEMVREGVDIDEAKIDETDESDIAHYHDNVKALETYLKHLPDGINEPTGDNDSEGVDRGEGKTDETDNGHCYDSLHFLEHDDVQRILKHI